MQMQAMVSEFASVPFAESPMGRSLIALLLQKCKICRYSLMDKDPLLGMAAKQQHVNVQGTSAAECMCQVLSFI